MPLLWIPQKTIKTIVVSRVSRSASEYGLNSFLLKKYFLLVKLTSPVTDVLSLYKHTLPNADWKKYYDTINDETCFIDINSDTTEVITEKFA